MKRLVLVMISSMLCAIAFAAEPAPAATGAEGLLKQYACIACHAVATKVVGPAYKDVAAKYRGNKDAEQMLIAKVKSGGVGTLGSGADAAESQRARRGSQVDHRVDSRPQMSPGATPPARYQ